MNLHFITELMDHSFCVGSHLYGLFKILFDLIQCWLWVGCGLVFQMGFPYIPDNAVQIIMKIAVKNRSPVPDPIPASAYTDHFLQVRVL